LSLLSQAYDSWGNKEIDRTERVFDLSKEQEKEELNLNIYTYVYNIQIQIKPILVGSEMNKEIEF